MGSEIKKPKLPEGFTWVEDAQDWPEDEIVIRLALSDGKWEAKGDSSMEAIRDAHRDHPESHRCIMRIPKVEYERRFVVREFAWLSRNVFCVYDQAKNAYVSTIASHGMAYTWPNTAEGRDKAQSVADALENALEGEA